MPKSANEVMQEIVFSAVLDALGALKAASKGLPNTLLRDIGALHANTTFADLPPELQAAITASTRAAFTRLLKEGYNVSSGQPEPRRAPAPRPDGPRSDRPRPDRPRTPPRGPGGGEGRRPPRGPSGGSGRSRRPPGS